MNDNNLKVSVLNVSRDGLPTIKHEHIITEGDNANTSHGQQIVFSMLFTPDEEPDSGIILPPYLKVNTEKDDLLSNAKFLLWREIETLENREDGQYARLFKINFSKAIPLESIIHASESFCSKLSNQGMIVDLIIKSDYKYNIDSVFKFGNAQSAREDNYSAYIMCPLRVLQNKTFGNKNREFNKKNVLKAWKEMWKQSLDESIYVSKVSNQVKPN